MIGVDIYHYTTDMPTLIPFIRKVQQDYHGVIQNVVADSGYASEKNYDFLERRRRESSGKTSGNARTWPMIQNVMFIVVPTIGS